MPIELMGAMIYDSASKDPETGRVTLGGIMRPLTVSEDKRDKLATLGRPLRLESKEFCIMLMLCGGGNDEDFHVRVTFADPLSSGEMHNRVDHWPGDASWYPVFIPTTLIHDFDGNTTVTIDLLINGQRLDTLHLPVMWESDYKTP